jgi:hypothetical protein
MARQLRIVTLAILLDDFQPKVLGVFANYIRSVQKIEAGQINVLVTTMIRIQNTLDCPWCNLMS